MTTKSRVEDSAEAAVCRRSVTILGMDNPLTEIRQAG